VINSNLACISRRLRDTATLFYWKLRPNRSRWRHGYYWQPTESRQRPIRWYHQWYRVATMRPIQTNDGRTDRGQLVP